jgi:hypothetical protein
VTPALDLDAELAEMAGQQPLGLVLRQAELAIGQLVELEQVVLRRMAVDDGAQAVDPEAGVDHLRAIPMSSHTSSVRGVTPMARQ